MGVTMPDDITPEPADAPAQTAAVAPATPDAPWGINPRTGQPYKRDPALFAHLRGKPRGTASRRARRRPPAPAGPTAPAPSRPAGAKRPAYGKRVAEIGALGLVLVPDPVDREIVARQLTDLGPIVDRLAADSPAVAAFLDRYLINVTGGAWLELAMWGAVTGGMLALNHGVHHPLLMVIAGAGVAEARKRAAETARQADQLRAQMTAEQWAADSADGDRVMAEMQNAPPPADTIPVILG